MRVMRVCAAAILASGRLVYYGRTQQMLTYFEELDYPCPLFKNPCDYYGNHRTSLTAQRLTHVQLIWLHTIT